MSIKGAVRLRAGERSRLRYRDRAVWTIDERDWQPDPNKPYITFVRTIDRE
jgi:hypothetical protein